jgi:HK97 family phage portal protein
MMGILARMDRTRLHAGPGPLDDFWYAPVGSNVPSSAGIPVSPDRAMRLTTVYACVKVLAETIMQLPLHLYRRRDDGGKERATDHPLYQTLRWHPNPWQGSPTWRETLQGHVALRGNAYSIIRPGRRGAVDSLIPVRPDFVRVEQMDDLRLRFWIRQKDGVEKPYTQDEVFRLPGLSDDGITGLSPIGMAREAIGLAQAAEGYGARFFRNSARPSGVLQTDQVLKPDDRGTIRDAWNELHAGIDQSHRVAVLDKGLKWSQMSMTAEDAQFLETRGFQRTEICSIFRVPPHMVGDLSRATFSNIEQQSIDFVVGAILPWVTRWEEAISRDLLPEEDREEYFAQFNLRGLLRGDSATRAAYYTQRFNIGTLSQNDIRRMEDEDPIEGGDRYFVPLNMVPSDRLDATLDAQSTAKAALPAPAAAALPSAGEAVSLDPDAFALLVHDVAERLAGAEIRELEKRMDKAAEDRARFNEWAGEFYGGHAAYVQKAVRPVASAWAMVRDEEPRTDAVASVILSGGLAAVESTADVPALVTRWRAERAAELSAIITEALYG